MKLIFSKTPQKIRKSYYLVKYVGWLSIENKFIKKNWERARVLSFCNFIYKINLIWIISMHIHCTFHYIHIDTNNFLFNWKSFMIFILVQYVYCIYTGKSLMYGNCNFFFHYNLCNWICISLCALTIYETLAYFYYKVAQQVCVFFGTPSLYNNILMKPKENISFVCLDCLHRCEENLTIFSWFNLFPWNNYEKKK